MTGFAASLLNPPSTARVNGHAPPGAPPHHVEADHPTRNVRLLDVPVCLARPHPAVNVAAAADSTRGRLDTHMAREPIPTWYFALVVVRRDDRFLLVHERTHGQLWYLPAGRAEFGETLEAAACRETLEETGVPIRLTGLLRIEHSPAPQAARVRALFLAEPVDGTPPKSVPDAESLGAAWVSIAELPNHPLRGPEVERILRHVARGGAVHPLGVLQAEGMPFAPP